MFIPLLQSSIEIWRIWRYVESWCTYHYRFLVTRIFLILRTPATDYVRADWQVLQHMIKCTMVRNTSAFLTKTPRAKYRPLPNPPPSHRAPLLPATSIDSFAIDDVPTESLRPAREPSPSEQQIPSTPGGLIIPPFPPRPSSRNLQRDGSHRLPVGDSIEVDEEAAIGGRTMKSEMEPSEAWSFLRDLFRSLDEFTV